MCSKLKYGDHIKVKIDSFYHHGVYLNDDQVIHYCSDEPFSILSKNLVINSTTLKFFAQGQNVDVVEYLSNDRFLPFESVRLAEEKIGEKDYDLLYNNCEHFVSSCLTGKRQSKLMEHLKEKNLRMKKREGVNGFLDSLYTLLKNNKR